MNKEQPRYSILIVTNDKQLLAESENGLCSQIKQYTFQIASTYKEAFRILEKSTIHILLVDIERLPMQEIDIVNYAKTRSANIEIIVITTINELEIATQSLRYGASFYVMKPITCTDLRVVIEKAAIKIKRNVEHLEFEQKVLTDLMAGNPAMQKVLRLSMKIAPTTSPVLIGGESGTGKEFFATIIHNLSQRHEGNFVAMNCGAVPDTLFESELFGYKKGAFTGADRDKPGLVEESNFGTLFLDEVGELSLQAQVKLLRFLQEHTYRRVGDPTLRSVNVRIIAATNKNLLQMTRQGAFREDLYYRLNVFYLHLPPLRERKETIPSLIRLFVNEQNLRLNKNINKISKSAEISLAEYHYPGNVRELKNIIEHAMILSEGSEITERELPDFMFKPRLLLPDPNLRPMELDSPQAKESMPMTTEEILPLETVEKLHIKKTLDRFNNNYSETSRALGISRSTLWRKINEYNIEARDYPAK